MSIMPEHDLAEGIDCICLIGHIRMVLIKEKSDTELKFYLAKSEKPDLLKLLVHTEQSLQIIIRPGKDCA